jgi:hypothetical protein
VRSATCKRIYDSTVAVGTLGVSESCGVISREGHMAAQQQQWDAGVATYRWTFGSPKSIGITVRGDRPCAPKTSFGLRIVSKRHLLSLVESLVLATQCHELLVRTTVRNSFGQYPQVVHAQFDNGPSFSMRV